MFYVRLTYYSITPCFTYVLLTACHARWRLVERRTSSTPVYPLPISRWRPDCVLSPTSLFPLFGAILVLGQPLFSLMGPAHCGWGDGCVFFSEHEANPLPSSSGDDGSHAVLIGLF